MSAIPPPTPTTEASTEVVVPSSAATSEVELVRIRQETEEYKAKLASDTAALVLESLTEYSNRLEELCRAQFPGGDLSFFSKIDKSTVIRECGERIVRRRENEK